MIRIGLLYGGRSGEHDVSLCSAASVFRNLDRSRYEVTAIGIDRDGRWYVQDAPAVCDDAEFGSKMELKKEGEWFLNHFECGYHLVLTERISGRRCEVDVVFPVVHGTYCEDGTLQGLLELAMVPYVGADVAGSVIGMDKDIAKRLLQERGIAVVPWVTVTRGRWNSGHDAILDEIRRELPLPLFVKPANAGSSVGIEKVSSYEELLHAIPRVLEYDSKILVEKGCTVREIECAVLGNENPEVSVPGEIVPTHDFYSYEAKYLDAQGARLMIPADLDEEMTRTVQRRAADVYRTLGCSGMARVDFFIDKNDGALYLNEINTLPGFTSISMYPKLWEKSGLPYSELLDRLVDLAVARHQTKISLRIM
jgi:D-alanine-D-alanine ligase